MGISSAEITKMLDGLKAAGLSMHSVLVMRKGEIVAEGYAEPYKSDTLHRMYSVSKSFVSIAVGVLAGEGKISINDTIDLDKDGNPLTYLDIISVDETVVDDIDLKIYTEKLGELIKNLPPREEEIIVLRYGLRGYKPLTQKEVAKHLGISRSYVSRIEKKALAELRDGFGKSVPDFD